VVSSGFSHLNLGEKVLHSGTLWVECSVDVVTTGTLTFFWVGTPIVLRPIIYALVFS